VGCDWIHFIYNRTKNELDSQRDTDIVSCIAARCNPDWLERTRIACAYHYHDNNIRWRTWLLNQSKKSIANETNTTQINNNLSRMRVQQGRDHAD
jgi:hypothetical protein